MAKKSVKIPPLKLGKLPARKGAITFKLATYLDKTVLPKPPKEFGHEGLLPAKGWQMLGNDAFGDCVEAGAAHETMMWNLEAKRTVAFDNKSVLSDYSAATGFDPNDPVRTDNGTDMQAYASYRRKTGIVDVAGARHRVLAYLAINPDDTTELYQAAYLFGAVGIGFEFPASAMDQFNRGQVWTVVKKSPIDGGHYVPMVGLRKGYIIVVTWGQTQRMAATFYDKYCDEAVVYLTEEMLTSGKSLEGFNLAQLQADLAALR